MPNWAECSLTLSGPPEEIARFREAVKAAPSPDHSGNLRENIFSLNSLVTQPAVFHGDGDAWYSWRMTYWGTKWDISDAVVTEDAAAGTVNYKFDSAWAPPAAWLAAVGPQFPKIAFRLFYAEDGCDFAGVCTVEGGSFVRESSDYATGVLAEYGEYRGSCEHCFEDVVLYSKTDPSVCEECLAHRCAHCTQLDKDHADRKCLFDATTFSPLSSTQGKP